MKSYLIVFFSLLMLLTISCSSSKKNLKEQSVQKRQEENEKLFIQYKKTSCYGRCPVYLFELYSDTTCMIDAEMFYKVEGKHMGKFTTVQFQKITDLLTELNFYELNAVYDDTLLQDAPTTYIAVNQNGKFKKVKNRAKAPVELVQFQTTLEAIIDEVEWK